MELPEATIAATISKPAQCALMRGAKPERRHRLVMNSPNELPVESSAQASSRRSAMVRLACLARAWSMGSSTCSRSWVSGISA